MLNTMTFIAKNTASESLSIVRRAWASSLASADKIDAAKRQPLQQNSGSAGFEGLVRPQRRDGTGKPQ
jgi:hypothetical protein